jgi:hypothetical protein
MTNLVEKNKKNKGFFKKMANIYYLSNSLVYYLYNLTLGKGGSISGK